MWLSRISLLLFPLSASVVYQFSTPFEGWFSVVNVCILSLLGYLAIEGVIRAAKSISTTALLNLFISTIVGFGATTFLVFCAEQLSHGTTIHPLVAPALILVLLCSFITITYFGLQTVPLLRSEETGSKAQAAATRKFVLDQSALEDGRIIDLARTGLFDGQIIIPAFLPQELKTQSEVGDETSKARARRALESLRRLESLPRFTMQSKEIPVIDTCDLNEKLALTAKRLNATLLTNEMPTGRPDGEQGLYLAVDTIASALRPAIPKGEVLTIKIQRLGKEPKQGIGYLEDGTMVVVNGGGDYLGRGVRTQVLSQKYSSSGKIVFCNVREEDDEHIPSYGPSEATTYGV
jgi:uncharacterized protein YacL